MARLSLLLLAAVVLLNVCAAGPVIEYMKGQKDLTTAATVLSSLVKKDIDPKAKFTLLAPTNEAIEAFRRDMRLTPAQFNDRTGLLDLVVAYHVIPGYQAKELKLEKSPSIAATGDVNYLLRFTNTDKGGVNVEDLQGNTVSLSKPVLIGNAAVIKIDRVLMSGSFFFDGKAALNYYPQWSEAKKFAEAVGYPDGTGREQDMTFFVPDNTAMQAVSGAVSKMSKEQQRDVFLYHITQPARSVPSDFKDGKIPTNLKGQEIDVSIKTDSSKTDAVTGKANAIPSVTLTSSSGNKANIKIFNVHVGKSLWQGVDAVLVPSTDAGAAKVQTESGGGNKNHRRSLLRWGGSRDNGYSQMYANTVAMDNTARAIEAAATGNIPTSYATRYGSYQADAAANGCVNCYGW